MITILNLLLRKIIAIIEKLQTVQKLSSIFPEKVVFFSCGLFSIIGKGVQHYEHGCHAYWGFRESAFSI